jgi:hypothetical protein
MFTMHYGHRNCVLALVKGMHDEKTGREFISAGKPGKTIYG